MAAGDAGIGMAFASSWNSSFERRAGSDNMLFGACRLCIATLLLSTQTARGESVYVPPEFVASTKPSVLSHARALSLSRGRGRSALAGPREWDISLPRAQLSRQPQYRTESLRP